MAQKFISRRTFVKEAAVIGGAALVGTQGALRLLAGPEPSKPDLVSVKGEDYFASTKKAVELLGGMGRFIPKGSRVGLIVNAPTWWKLPGSHTNTDIVLATIALCLDAGIKDIAFLQDPASGFWERSGRSKAMADLVQAPKKCSGNFIEAEVKGIALKKAKIIKEFLDCDAVIDLPVGKHHEGTNFSGNLKNMMGCCSSDTCRFFHAGSGAKGEYEDVDFLSQCIADLGLLRKPNFCIVDSTVVLENNGPAGPGTLRKPQCVVAGKDPVAVDAYCVGLLGRKPAEIIMLSKASAHGLGTMDMTKVVVKEAVL